MLLLRSILKLLPICRCTSGGIMRAATGRRVAASVIGLCLTLSSLLFSVIGYTSEENVIIVSEADFALVSQETPPVNYSQKKLLPDIWRLDDRYDTSPSAWYRFTLPAGAPANSWSVVLPKFTQNIDVYFNGESIGTSDPTRSMPINWNRPFVFELPQNYWNEGDNYLEVRLSTMPNWGALAPIAVGSSEPIWEIYNTAYFFQITTNQIASWMCLVLCLIALLYWFADRKNTTYGWFGLAVFFWAILATNYYLTEFPISVPFWAVVFHSANEWFAVSMALFTHRFFNLKHPRIELGLFVFAFLATGIYCLAYFVLEERGPAGLHAVSLAIGYYNFFTALTMTVRKFDYRSLTYALVTIAISGLFFHDTLFSQAAVDVQSPARFYLAQLGVPLLLGFMLMVLTKDFVSALIEARQANETLEERVTKISLELEQSYLERQTLEREQATLKERERIYHDIHDDLGAKLLSIVYQTDDDQTQELARSAINDVRSIVSSSGATAEVFDGPSQWFSEAQQRCDEANITLNYEGPEHLTLQDHYAYQITRIIRELVTNALKHAQCSEIHIKIAVDEENLVIQVSDNGIGLNGSITGSGSDGTRHRATKLGGQISWSENHNSGKGTAVRLEIPSAKIGR